MFFLFFYFFFIFFFISKYIYLVFILGIRQGAKLMDISVTSQTLYGILCELVMSQHPTIEQYQTYKCTFIHTNIYKLQFIKMQYNSDCYTCPL